jgi:hypothetical protein
MLDSSLTEVGKYWKQKDPAITPTKMLMNEAAFDQEKAQILWTQTSIYTAGGLLIISYFLAFSFWTSGFALLAKNRSGKN